MPTIAAALLTAIQRLSAAGIHDAPRDARRLMAFALRIAPDRLTLHLPDGMTEPQAEALEAALRARARRQPVAQITGRRLFWGHSFRVTRDTLDPRPETEVLVAGALAQLRARDVPLAICTNKPEALVPPLLQHLGIADAFALVLGGDSLPQRKPSGEPLRHIATHFGLPVEDCLMVGDSLTDYRAAEDAGMPIALVRYGYPRGLDLATAHAVAVIDDLRELPGLQR